MLPALRKIGAQVPCYGACRRAVEKTVECKGLNVQGSDPCKDLPTDNCLEDYAGYLAEAQKKRAVTPTSPNGPKPTSTKKSGSGSGAVTAGYRKRMQGGAAIVADVILIAAFPLLILWTL